MASKAQVQKFIKKLSALAIAEAKKRDKWVLPSVCIAQAALETGWGTSTMMTKANAYFGIKATKAWKGKVYNASTKECYDGATYTNIAACFRAYDSLAESVADYFDLVTKSDRYSLAVNEKNANKAITAIKNGGYATAPNYIDSVMSIINGYNLTQYDDFEESTEVTVKEWQDAAIADGFKFPLYGADGKWGDECASVAKKAVCKMRTSYKFKNLTRIVQRVVGAEVDGKFGKGTRAAVIAYQKEKGLAPDGAVGLNTWKAILGIK